ncbi:MAG: hybrid sensor histidine kinase/response regulator, partial [Victivallaceae bacterium]|nr:hybrid sensor histidine kinase/response regulator [Victivallaceae bacterium]
REKTVKNIVLVIVPLFAALYILYLWIYISRHIVKPLTEAADFSNQLSGGKFPLKLQTGSASNEIVILTKSLNYLRDRLHNTIKKLEKSHEREKNARLAAEKASNLKSGFLSRLSPELRTPLNSINGYIEIIRDELRQGRDDRLPERIGNISRNAKILNRQVANLLDIGELGGGQKYLNVTEFNTGDFMRELLEYCSFCQQEKDITLVNHLSPGMPEKLNTDREALSLLLSSLIRAVTRVSRPGEVISCGCEPVNDKLVFWVRDNRRAEPYENLAALFKRLTPDSDFSSTATPTMLNMMLAATKAAGLGAELNAESRENAACEFTVTFPAWDIVSESSVLSPRLNIVLNYAEREEDVVFESDENQDLALEAPRCSKHFRVLVAEDDKDNAEILNTLLTADGEEIQLVDNGPGCIEALAEDKTDILVLSLFLPETDIFTLVRKIRATKGPKELPIIVVTGYLSQYDRQRLIVSGVNRCFIKPLNFGQFRQMIRNLAG